MTVPYVRRYVECFLLLFNWIISIQYQVNNVIVFGSSSTKPLFWRIQHTKIGWWSVFFSNFYFLFFFANVFFSLPVFIHFLWLLLLLINYIIIKYIVSWLKSTFFFLYLSKPYNILVYEYQNFDEMWTQSRNEKWDVGGYI